MLKIKAEVSTFLGLVGCILKLRLRHGVNVEDLFDARRYRAAHLGGRGGWIAALMDYCLRGEAEGCAPNNWFDPFWYLNHHEDVAQAGLSPFLHFLRNGVREGRRPVFWFDAAWCAEHTGVEDARSSFLWFLAEGSARRAQPNRWFDPDWYLSENPDVGSTSLDAIAHYFNIGEPAGCRPTHWFDPTWYTRAYGDVREAGLSPFRHFIESGGVEGRAPAYWFDPDWYAVEHGIGADGAGAAFEHFLEAQDETRLRPSLWFDPNAYGGAAKNTLFAISHYETEGDLSGRRPAEWFDPVHYRQVASEAGLDIAAGETSLSHFLRVGAEKGLAPSREVAAAARPAADDPDPMLLAGYHEADLGLGAASRALFAALDGGDLDIAAFPLRRHVAARIKGALIAPPDRAKARRRVFELGVPEFPEARAYLDRLGYLSLGDVLRPYWELERVPETWRPLLEGVDEIWTATTFMRDAFAALDIAPVKLAPPCVSFIDQPDGERAQKAEGPFTFLFTFDYHSSAYRKNPLGVAQAFIRAFPKTNRDVRLTIKHHGDHALYPEIHRALEMMAADDDRISLIGRYLSNREMANLFRDCGCYVSLHRAEGLGLGMAEAMGLGKPVIATDYSGSKDFVNARTAFPVAYRMIDIEPGQYALGEGGVWAEPIQESAVEAMREVFLSESLRLARSVEGRAYIRMLYSPKRVAAEITGLLMRSPRRVLC